MDFQNEFPDDRACLEFILKLKFPHGTQCPECAKRDCLYPVEGRRAYSCSWCGHQTYPTAGTIFHKSPTSLRSWFFAIFLMAQSRNGVAAKEIERQVGVTYKCAWRMAHQIRKLMADGGDPLRGIVEADETYVGGVRKGKRGRGAAGKTAVVGLVARQGDVRCKVVEKVNGETLLGNIQENVAKDATIYSDELNVYKKLTKLGFTHDTVSHGIGQFARGVVHTNSIEGFWSQVKRSISGTHHSVSKKWLQNYVNEFAFRYNRRKAFASMFSHIVAKAGERHVEAA